MRWKRRRGRGIYICLGSGGGGVGKSGRGCEGVKRVVQRMGRGI